MTFRMENKIKQNKAHDSEFHETDLQMSYIQTFKVSGQLVSTRISAAWIQVQPKIMHIKSKIMNFGPVLFYFITAELLSCVQRTVYSLI